MELLLRNSESIVVSKALAKELGLYEAVVLLELHRAIRDTGVRKDGRYQIARTTKELREMFPWCRAAIVTKALERLQSEKILIISEDTMFDQEAKWYSLNEMRLRGLKSLVVLSTDEIKAGYIPVPPPDKSEDESPKSLLYRAVFGAVLEACHWDDAPALSQRDRAEVGQVTKAIIKKPEYKNHEIEDLVLMIRGFDIYRQTTLKQQIPSRPFGMMRQWKDYADWCVAHNNGEPPR